MKLVISVDVEEEGLFSGSYPRRPPGVENVRRLHRLEFITGELGLPLTLLATYPVVSNPSCREILTEWREKQGAEIGAHLHPWSTPPFEELPFAEPVPSDLLPAPLLQAKIETLLAALNEHMRVRPRAFRMGRFDLGKQVLALLPQYGFRVDSSLVPLRRMAGGPDHFLAPSDPHPLPVDGRSGFGPLLEAPLTQVGLFPAMSNAFYHLASSLPPDKGNRLFSAYRHLAVAGIQPAWFPLASMKLATRLHRLRGGKVLTMFLHSSELLPGATPSFRSEAAVDRLIAKIRSYLTWLMRTEHVRGVTLSGLYDSWRGREAKTRC